MKFLKFKTYKNITEWSKLVNWKEFSKIILIPFALFTFAAILPKKESSGDSVSLLFIYLLLLICALLLLLNSYISFLIIKNNKEISDKEIRKLKLEEVEYNKKKLFKWKKLKQKKFVKN